MFSCGIVSITRTICPRLVPRDQLRGVNPAVPNEPEGVWQSGIRTCWNDRSFVLHSRVITFEISLRSPLMESLVGCSVRHFLTPPLESGIWRNILHVEAAFVCG